MNKYKINIAGNEYIIEVSNLGDLICFEYVRNGTTLSSVSIPPEMRDSVKMAISEKLLQSAIYEINHFVEKININ